MFSPLDYARAAPLLENEDKNHCLLKNIANLNFPRTIFGLDLERLVCKGFEIIV